MVIFMKNIMMVPHFGQNQLIWGHSDWQTLTLLDTCGVLIQCLTVLFFDELKVCGAILHQMLFQPFWIFLVSIQQMHSLVAWVLQDGFVCRMCHYTVTLPKRLKKPSTREGRLHPAVVKEPKYQLWIKYGFVGKTMLFFGISHQFSDKPISYCNLLWCKFGAHMQHRPAVPVAEIFVEAGRAFWQWPINQFLSFFIIVSIVQGSFEVKLPTIWTDGKTEVGRVSEEKESVERISEKIKNQKKEDAGGRKGRKVVKHNCFVEGFRDLDVKQKQQWISFPIWDVTMAQLSWSGTQNLGQEIRF